VEGLDSDRSDHSGETLVGNSDLLSAENETQQKKIIEIDARPNDCIAMATQQLAPIFVSLDFWDEVEDMTEVLRKLQQKGPDMEEGDEE
jgi:hypothetical protein